MVIHALDKHIHIPALKSIGKLMGNLIDRRKQPVEPVLDNSLINLVIHRGSRRSGSLRIYEGIRTVIAGFADHIKCLKEILLRLPGESNNYICCDGDIRHGCLKLVNKRQITLLRIVAVHHLQYPVTSRL